MHGSVADQVLHTTRTPLLLIRPAEDGHAAPDGLHGVIVPLDGSPLAEAVLPYAAAIAAAFGVPLTLLRSVETVYLFTEPSMAAAGSYQLMLDSLQQAAEEESDHRR